jgi:D-alanyl-D-alanine carboxypeptidase/D-alanyl-D-alanine-endopeptidase (penicillin-binding protein 4)
VSRIVKNRVLIFLLGSALAALLIIRWREQRTDDVPRASEVVAAAQPSEVVSESSAAPARGAELKPLVDEALKNPAMAPAALGLCVLDGNGEVLFEHHARRSFIPASSLKTVTTATALEILGPEFRFQTELRATAPMTEGVIEGDLVIVGGGDPLLSLAHVKAWAAELKSRGLVRVKGRVVGDGRLFPGTIFADFWNWGDIGNAYGSAVSGLNLEHNRYEAVFDAGDKEGAPARFVKAYPDVAGVQWINEVLTGAAGSGDGVVIHGGERTGVIHLRGSAPLGMEGFVVGGAVPDPERFAAHHLREALVAAGVSVEGAAVSVHSLAQQAEPLPQAANTLITHQSDSLLDLITSIHATSDNHETECLYRLLGVRAKKAPDDVVREHWLGRGLVFEGLRMVDGCGLARADFIRPIDLAKLQYLAAHGPHGDAYKKSLLSKEDGSLRWKGGAMSGVRTVTGYVVGASDEELCFAFMANHYSDEDAVSKLREEWIAATKRL